MYKLTRAILFLSFIAIFTMCSQPVKEHLLTGRTMGTTYHIKIISNASDHMGDVQRRIDQRLEQINQSMSTYRKESEISRFNRLRAVNQPFRVSPDFFKVMQAGHTIYALTEGAWDGTVNPLIHLWGFGNARPIQNAPPNHAIEEALKKVGFHHIDLSTPGYLKKRRSQITVDLASIAKGYGVDTIATLLREMGYRNFVVEIGGEVFAAGRRLDGHQWKIGINQPQKGGAATAVYKALTLEDYAMATSGDYRNYLKIDGRAYSHIIDPRTGYPVNNGVVSATVVAPNCTVSDGLATALMVMGPAKGMELLNRLEKTEGLIIVKQDDGTFRNHWSQGLIPQTSTQKSTR